MKTITFLITTDATAGSCDDSIVLVVFKHLSLRLMVEIVACKRNQGQRTARDITVFGSDCLVCWIVPWEIVCYEN